ncbi:hypothetical protein RF11_13156 [Thelohanellus kitauei]|uniref:Uncharacterized protein n=1 Tax=Thelohanellus kitauei TaxID=669202 RepID=A0A0C2IZR2_THEKT|nr:hypothetical protein RF11_13156 [Thelohanellus kitauei]
MPTNIRQSKSYIDVGSIYVNLMHIAEIMKTLNEWEEAGDAYFSAAVTVDRHKIPYISGIKTYELSIECFLRIRSTKAYRSFQKVIDNYLQENKILEAIQHCIDYGYLCKKVFEDRYKSEEFYQKADELRIHHNIPHTCAITEFDRNKRKVLDNALDDWQNFFVNEQHGACTERAIKSVCGKCVEAFENLNAFIIALFSFDVATKANDWDDMKQSAMLTVYLNDGCMETYEAFGLHSQPASIDK